MAETKYDKTSLAVTIKFVFLSVIIYAFIFFAGEFINVWIVETFNLKENLKARFIVMIALLFMTIISFYMLNSNPIDVLGVKNRAVRQESP